MPNDPLQIPLMKLGRTIVALKPVLIDAIGVEALKFIDDNFAKQGYQGASFQPWPKRKSKTKGAARAILVQNAVLRRSMKKKDRTDGTTLGTDIIYARVHNMGGDINHPARQAILNFNNRIKTIDFEVHGKLATRFSKQRSATFSQKVSIGAYTTKMPRRQFIPTADSPAPLLTQRCEGIILKKILKELK